LKFSEAGPNIPDDLLVARDEGRVVFFCGAGVSLAKAALPDFFGLAEKVLSDLGSLPDSEVNRLLKFAKKNQRDPNVNISVSADRIFGLLEREFDTHDIHCAVARSLRPKSRASLSAHKIMLDLATTSEGNLRLLTTNFDLLFEKAADDLTTYTPSYLPDLRSIKSFNGVVYLHGKVQSDYSAAESGGLVLSTSEFGNAYLADGWATQFIKTLSQKNILVFVGYSAEDPPMQYLLEALNRSSFEKQQMYAFQHGSPGNARALWAHKGVNSIAFYSYEDLWNSLKQWSGRAINPVDWIDNVIKKSSKGPMRLKPYQRGQVAHLVSNSQGSKRLIESNYTLPASWINVFDKFQRYKKPSRIGEFGTELKYQDPFENFGLDSDVVPSKIDPEEFYEKREVPSFAWHAFDITSVDQIESGVEELEGLIPRDLGRGIPVGQRLQNLGIWFANVAHQPGAFIWAAGQSDLHKLIKNQIEWRLQYRPTEFSNEMRQAWHYLLETWVHTDYSGEGLEWHQFEDSIAVDGWSTTTVRRFANLMEPKVTASRPFLAGHAPLKRKPGLHDLVSLEINYAEIPQDFDVPDEYLTNVLDCILSMFGRACDLDIEVRGYEYPSLVPINSSRDPDVNGYERGEGLSGWMLYYVSLIRRLSDINETEFKSQIRKLSLAKNIVAERILVWSAGKPELTTVSEAFKIINNMSVDDFWSFYGQRDLLISLHARWADLSDKQKMNVEKRILSGPKKWNRESKKKHAQRSNWEILDRLFWLQKQGCHFTFDVEKKTDELNSQTPKWQERHGEKAAASQEGRGGWVKTKTEFGVLQDQPLNTILSISKDQTGREDISLTRLDPFSGLSKAFPLRAFKALVLSQNESEFPKWAWEKFLNPEIRQGDSERLLRSIALRLLKMLPAELVQISRSVCRWLRDKTINEKFANRFPDIFQKLIDALTNALLANPGSGKSAIVRKHGSPVDWSMEAINSLAGDITELLFLIPEVSGKKPKDSVSREWFARVEKLLSLGGDLRSFILVILCKRLNWFFWMNEKWTREFLIITLDGENKNAIEAF